MSVSLHRRLLTLSLIGLFTISACEAKKMPKTVVLDMVLFNYLPRPVFDVYVNGRAGLGSGAYPETGGGVIVGAEFQLGSQEVSWRLGGPEGMVRNGETVRAKNVPEVQVIPPGSRYVAIHIYPDETVEITFSEFLPDETAKGTRIGQEGMVRSGER